MEIKTDVYWNEDRTAYVLSETEDYLVDMIQMLYNQRVVLTPKSRLQVYDAGWCYPSTSAAVLAVAAWDWETEPEPVGYIKRVGFTDEWVRQRAQAIALASR